MQKRFCDICEKEIGRVWWTLESIGKEMDYGMEIGGGKWDICSLKCLSDFVKERLEKEKKEIKHSN
jgi:hypothetical protein